jgi:Protein of unknown function (DUF3800)
MGIMLMLTPLVKQAKIGSDWREWNHPNDHPCMEMLALVSGLPKHLRDRTSVVMMQAYFDDTGKSGHDPFFILAGFKARAKNWAAFSDAWQQILDKKPKLKYIKAYEAYHLKDKTSQFFGWSEKDRDVRLCACAKVLQKYVKFGITFSIPTDDYHAVFDWISGLPHPNYRAFKNPFFLAFLALTGVLIHSHADSRTRERIEILADEGIDNKKRLQRGYEEFVKVIQRQSRDTFNLLVNKEARFANDECVGPLQGADLLAWHYRQDLEAKLKGLSYLDPVWLELKKIDRHNFGYDKTRLTALLEEAVLLAIREVDAKGRR